MTYKIVGEENGAYWIEVLHENYTGKTITKMLLFLGDRTNPATMEVRALKTRDKNGHVSELMGPMLQLMKSVWQGIREYAGGGLAGAASGGFGGRCRPLFWLLQGTHRCQLWSVARRFDVVVPSGSAYLGPGAQPRHRPSHNDGSRRLRRHRCD